MFVSEGDAGPYRRSEYAWLFNAPEIYERPSPKRGLTLRRLLRAIGHKNGAWYVEDFEVLRDGARIRVLENCSWADWQSNGDLLFALDGKLYRVAAAMAQQVVQSPIENATLVAESLHRCDFRMSLRRIGPDSGRDGSLRASTLAGLQK